MKRVIPRASWLSALLLLLLLLACSGPGTPSPTPQPPVEPIAPTVPEGLTPGTWNVFTPGGDTICADGSDYAFYVYPGTVNKVVVDFEGGGACWSGATCGAPGQFYQPSVPALEGRVEGVSGLYERDNPQNPTRDWYHVFVSYCTADVHLGDAVQTYITPEGDDVTVRHNGQDNVAAVLEWLYDGFSGPESVLVTGCSAGAYGAALYTSAIAEHYPNADITELGDCGAGIIPGSFASAGDGLKRWNIGAVLPAGINLSEGVPATFLADAYVANGQAHPNVTLAQYNSYLDSTQIAFYAVQVGLDPSDPADLQQAAAAWTSGLVGSLQTIGAGLPEGFSSYLSLLDDDGDLQTGTAHCILGRPEFYTLTTSGAPFVTWLGRLINGAAPPQPVTPPADALPLGQSLKADIG